MKKYKLRNGLTLIYEQKPSKSVAIEILAKVGSNHENSKVFGISHFIEHMFFEGTKKRKNSQEIANEIEKLGGDMNAYTTTDRTCYFIKILNKHFDIALDVMADMLQNSQFTKEMVEKERKVILKEIDMVNDQPRFFQWILFEKNIFSKNNAKNPTYGSRKSVSRITRQDIVNYFQKHYVPNNMVMIIVGNVKDVKNKIEKAFKDFQPKEVPTYKKVYELENKGKKVVVKRKLNNSYVVLGYKTPNRLSRESYVLDLIHGVLGRGQSGRIFNEIRNKRGLSYEVGINHETSLDFGFFAIYMNIDAKNIELAKNIILKEFEKLKKIDVKDINEAKTFIEGQFYMENEDNFHLADKLAYWELMKDADLVNEYLEKINKVNKKDIIQVVNKFLNKKYTLAVVQQP